MQALHTAGTLTEQDNRKNIAFDFDVPSGTKRIVTKFSYTPKEVPDAQKAGQLLADGMKKYDMDVVSVASFMPVRNFITLSFDELGDFRGACHRHPNEQTIVISDTDSTPGIINRPISAGKWDVVINVHFVGSDIQYSIDIDLEVE